MASGINSSIIGQAEREFGQMQIKGKSELGKEDFLTLLVAQLSSQDPLNPMDDKEFVSQLSEFSSLEQLTNISSGIDSMNESSGRQEMLTAVSFIGKEVRSEGYGVSKSGEQISSLYFSLGEPIANGTINIYDPNMNLIRTEMLGPKQAGNYQYDWDGLDYQGNVMPDGVYTIGMQAEGADGKPTMVKTEVSGRVAGVQTEGTEQYLRLNDGRMVRFTSVKEVVDSSVQSATANDGSDAETVTQ